jgi:hypothetical protein
MLYDHIIVLNKTSSFILKIYIIYSGAGASGAGASGAGTTGTGF